MLISSSHRFCFIHIPKTGGSSITAALAAFLDEPKVVRFGKGWSITHHALGGMHGHARSAPIPEGLRVWHCCRNPYTRAISLWRTHHRHDESFAAFVGRLLGQDRNTDRGGRVMLNRSRPQYWWLNGELHRSASIRFEDLDREFSYFCSEQDLPSIRLPHINHRRGPFPPWQDLYTEPIRQNVAEFYENDFSTFSYPTEIS